MKAIEPPAKVSVGPLQLIATEADRLKGLRATVMVLNGTVQKVHQVLLADEADRLAFATEVASANPPATGADIDVGLRQLMAVIEDSLRETRPPTQMGQVEAGVLRASAGDGKHWEMTENGIELVKEFRRGTERKPIIQTGFVAKKRVLLDGETFFEIEDEGATLFIDAEAFVARLRRQGRVVSRKDAPDAVSAILHAATKGKIERGHAAVGVYAAENGDLALCLAPRPVREEQIQATKEMTQAVGAANGVSAAQVQAYLDFAARFHAFEAFPSMGIAAMAPFAFVLRGEHVLVPGVYNYSYETDLGKSGVSLAFSEYLYGRRAKSAGSISSDYRLISLLDAAGTTVAVEEAAALSPKFFEGLKDRAERQDAGLRGTKDLGMERYLSRSVLLFSANSLVFGNLKAVLKRYICPRFDDAMKASRKAAAGEYERLLGSLEPIGFALTSQVLATYPTKARLLEAITKVQTDLRLAYSFRGPTRAQSYAVVYLGLLAWRDLAASVGITWPVPTTAEFAERVIGPCEASTFEGETSAVRFFARWLQRFLVLQRDREGNSKGEGVLWKSDVIDGRDGVWVTDELVDMANREHAQNPERQINLAELARGSAAEFGLRVAAVTDLANGRGAKVVRIGPRTVRAAFIPTDAGGEPEVRQGPLDGIMDDGPASGNVVTTAVDEAHPAKSAREVPEPRYPVTVPSNTLTTDPPTVTVRVLADLGPFVASDKALYTLRQGDLASLPEADARHLAKLGKVAQITPADSGAAPDEGDAP